jgi:membrane-bound inhibitor of C-type lysozyme
MRSVKLEHMKKSTLAVIVLIILGIFAGSVFALIHTGAGLSNSNSSATSSPNGVNGGNTVIFACNSGASITATFYPENDTHVDLSLSDGRTMSVPHTPAGAGARYANADESFVFWNKGETAYISENGSTTYTDCFLPSNSSRGASGNQTGVGENVSSGQTGSVSNAATGSTQTALQQNPAIATSLLGKVACLPNKDTGGPQTLECALGLQTADGNYYELSNLTEAGVMPGQIDVGMDIIVTGMLSVPDASFKYDITGNMSVQSLKKQ